MDEVYRFQAASSWAFFFGDYQVTWYLHLDMKTIYAQHAHQTDSDYGMDDNF